MGKEIDAQALFSIDEERRARAEDLETGLPSLREDAKTALQSQTEEAMKEIADQGLEADRKTVVEEICNKKFDALQAKMVVDYYKQHIQAWGTKCFTAQPEVLNILAAIAFFIGYTKADVYPPRKTMLKWAQLKEFVSEDSKKADDFFAKLESTSLDIGRKGLADEQKLKSIQSVMPPDFDAEKAKAIDPA